MNMAKRTRRARAGAAAQPDVQKKEIAVPKGLNYKKVAGIVITVVGVLLVLVNLTQVLIAFAGFVLVYFGLRLLGYTVKI
jgi:hypothetical protein